MASKSHYLQIYVRVSQYESRKFKELKEKHNLSARDVLEISGCSCDKCPSHVIIVDENTGEDVLIPKGILSRKKNKW